MAETGSVLQAFGFGIQGFSALQGAESEADAANFNAELAREDATLTRIQGAEQGRILQIQQAKQIGQMRASFSASGVQLSSGSPLEVMTESVAGAAADQFILKFNTEVRAKGIERNVALNEMRAKSARKAGRIGLAGSILFGAGALA